VLVRCREFQGLVVSAASLKMPNCVWLIYPVARVGNTKAAISNVCIVSQRGVVEAGDESGRRTCPIWMNALTRLHPTGQTRHKACGHTHSNASPSLPDATNRFHSPRHDCISVLIFLFSATFAIQFKYTSSSSGTKNDDSRDKTVSKLADSDVMCSAIACQLRSIRRNVHTLTSISPYDRDRDNNEQIRPFEQECVPQSQVGLKRDRIREKRDIPFRCVRSRRNHVLFESRIDPRHQLLHNTFLHVYRFEQTRESRAKDVMHVVGVMEVNKRRICALGRKVIKEHGGDGSHSLTVSAFMAAQREAMQDVE
jgi:hypothetical protein